jgi:hypothetical protein
MPPRTLFFGLVIAVIAAAQPPAQAQLAVVPKEFTTAPAESNFTTPIRDAARVQHNFFDSSVIDVGSEPVYIIGMNFRLDNISPFAPGVAPLAAWPREDLSISRYDVLMAQPSTVVSDSNLLTTTFANNIGANATQVRTGALSIPANNYLANGTESTPASFGLVPILFDTPYLYTPGEDLLLEIRHTGWAASAQIETFQPNWDSSNQASLFNTRAATSGPDATESLGNIFNTNVVQFVTTPIPEPSSIALLGLAGLTLIRRRRR